MHGIVWEADSLLGPTVLEEMEVSTPTGWSEQAEIAQVLFTRASSSAAATRPALGLELALR
jgi:hypothetical protein